MTTTCRSKLMNTLKIGGLDAPIVKRMALVISKANAYCTRRCGKWGSPSCFSCLFRDVRKLHKDIVSNGSDDDRQGDVGKAASVQLVRQEVNEPCEDTQPRGQVNTADMRGALPADAAEAERVGLVGGSRLPQVGQENLSQR